MILEQGKILISGVEPHPERGPDGEQLWRVFIGPRWRWRYLIVNNAEGHHVYGAFVNSRHLYGGVPDDAQVFEVPDEQRDPERDSLERAAWVREIIEMTR